MRLPRLVVLAALGVTSLPLGWIEIPKCDNYRLGFFAVRVVRDGTRRRLTVDRLDTVALSGEPIVHLSFEFREVR